jgi:hypothetical protein
MLPAPSGRVCAPWKALSIRIELRPSVSLPLRIRPCQLQPWPANDRAAAAGG